MTKKVSAVSLNGRTINRNNPLNLRASSSNDWVGKQTPAGAPFEVFDTLDHGIRASVITLRSYYKNHGLMTIKQIITRFAPPSENNTTSYIDYVSKQMALSKTAILPYSTTVFANLVASMSAIESGFNNRLLSSEVQTVITKFGLL